MSCIYLPVFLLACVCVHASVGKPEIHDALGMSFSLGKAFSLVQSIDYPESDLDILTQARRLPVVVGLADGHVVNSGDEPITDAAACLIMRERLLSQERLPESEKSSMYYRLALAKDEERNIPEASVCLMKASCLGNLNAQIHLCEWLMTRRITKGSVRELSDLWAAQQVERWALIADKCSNSARALSVLHELYTMRYPMFGWAEPNYEKGCRALERLAVRGDPEAQLHLAHHLLQRHYKVMPNGKPDYFGALQWLECAAVKGHKKARCSRANLWTTGTAFADKTPRLRNGLKELVALVSEGYAAANVSIAYFYNRGLILAEDGSVDNEKAMLWCYYGFKSGHMRALRDLMRYYPQHQTGLDDSLSRFPFDKLLQQAKLAAENSNIHFVGDTLAVPDNAVQEPRVVGSELASEGQPFKRMRSEIGPR